MPNFLDEDDIDLVIDEIVNNKVFQKLDTEIETYESIEELKFPQEYEDGGIIILDDLNENLMILVFKQSLKDLSLIIYLYSLFVKIIMNYQKERLELTEKYTTYSNQITSEMYKIFFKIKPLWT